MVWIGGLLEVRRRSLRKARNNFKNNFFFHISTINQTMVLTSSEYPRLFFAYIFLKFNNSLEERWSRLSSNILRKFPFYPTLLLNSGVNTFQVWMKGITKPVQSNNYLSLTHSFNSRKRLHGPAMTKADLQDLNTTLLKRTRNHNGQQSTECSYYSLCKPWKSMWLTLFAFLQTEFYIWQSWPPYHQQSVAASVHKFLSY